ncbi:hypothetical protein LDENG_00248740 [Lucifuga dentata]|nr:hypothetical protein LDENG_00248740 [Lucifuga dentata]
MELPGIGEQSDRAELMTWLRMDFLELAARPSLGSSAKGQDRIPELPEAASSLFRLNQVLFGSKIEKSTRSSAIKLLHCLNWKPETESGGKISERLPTPPEKVTDGAEPRHRDFTLHYGAIYGWPQKSAGSSTVPTSPCWPVCRGGKILHPSTQCVPARPWNHRKPLDGNVSWWCPHIPPATPLQQNLMPMLRRRPTTPCPSRSSPPTLGFPSTSTLTGL